LTIRDFLGRRRQSLKEALTKALEEDFDGRVIPFGVAAAQAAFLSAYICVICGCGSIRR
jgi:hypothetical protein